MARNLCDKWVNITNVPPSSVANNFNHFNIPSIKKWEQKLKNHVDDYNKRHIGIEK